MIIRPVPLIRAPFSSDLASTPDIYEGRGCKLNSDGEIELAATEDEMLGVISEPDSRITGAAGNATYATIILKSCSGIFEIQIAADCTTTAGLSTFAVDTDGKFTANLEFGMGGSPYVAVESRKYIAGSLVPVARLVNA